MSAIIPAWSACNKLNGYELYFEVKECDRGNFWYRKLIPNKRHTVILDHGEVNALKSSGRWLHEDDFAVKFINQGKKDVAVVTVESGLIDRLVEKFDISLRKWIV